MTTPHRVRRAGLTFATLALLAVPAASGQDQAAPALEGAWRFTINEGLTPIATADRMLSVEGGQLVVEKPAENERVVADAKNGSFTVPMVLQGVDGNADVPAVVTVRPTDVNGRMTGTAVIANKSYNIIASPLPSLWACSHNDPTHTAASSDEMKALTAKHRCKGWHRMD